MPRWIDVQVEFTWPLRVDDHHIADIDCRARGRVWDGGSAEGMERDYLVGRYRDFEVWDGQDWQDAGWLEGFIKNYLIIEAIEEQRFIDRALSEGFGPNPDTVRDLRAAQ